jgi:predicted hydrocarbon binding protein/KaiC/GvpD/RAD55 family RecA-like ATPase
VGDGIIGCDGEGCDMEKRGLSLAEIQEVPRESLILLLGPPGAGKSTFCHEIVLNGLASDRPILFVTTEQSPTEIMAALGEKGMEQLPHGLLSFVDAFGQTVGLITTERSDTVIANCEDLNSISMAIAKLQQKTGRSDVVLSFDSLTSPYLFNKEEIFRFMRLCLLKFASEGNSVVALMDEGCGKEEDLGAMMSVADGIIRMEIKERSRIINVVKHPKVAPSKIETPMTWSPTITSRTLNPRMLRRIWESQSFAQKAGKEAFRTENGDFVNMFWTNLALWGGMLWDPKRVPTMAYEFQKETHVMSAEMMSEAPWRMRLMMKLFMPKSFSKVKDMKKFASYFMKSAEGMGMGIWEHVKEASSKDEHYFRVYENSTCWPLDSVGARLGFNGLGTLAGMLEGFEKEERDWSVVETMCIGKGDPCCEFKVVPRETLELKEFLESINSPVVEKIHQRLMEQLTGFLVHGEPLPERPRLKSGIAFNQMFMVSSLPSLVSDRYRMALRMGGAKTGKEVGERLIEAGVTGDEAIKRVIDFMEYCKAGEVTLGDTVKIRENCESFGLETGEMTCFFTTGFLNGLFSAIKNQHVREIKCVAAGDPYCEWEII